MAKNNTKDINAQTFSCAVCFDEFDVSKRHLCGSDSEADRHSFCEQCVLSHAKAATEEMPLADGGIGLKCMEVGCEKAILYSKAIQKLIPRNLRKRIDERMAEENLAKSGLIVERCKGCNFAIEMEESKEENNVFACPNCQKNWCRLCERPWDAEHFELSCAEMDDNNNLTKKQRELEYKLNEAVIRKCSCGLQFTKADGCNKMVCRCGMKQCYICRAENVDYDHFCQHEFNDGEKCPCGKKCTIWANTNHIDEQNINRIRKEAANDGVVLNHPVIEEAVVARTPDEDYEDDDDEEAQRQREYQLRRQAEERQRLQREEQRRRQEEQQRRNAAEQRRREEQARRQRQQQEQEREEQRRRRENPTYDMESKMSAMTKRLEAMGKQQEAKMEAMTRRLNAKMSAMTKRLEKQHK